ncbi:MAG: methionyl-tRNA formyltransferase [Actinomycetaceae bacterium]|nr:methionyl-tRNA formyltransferase [Actinomycetaceae bacterium]
MRILFAGTPDVAIPSLERLIADGHDVAAVLTRQPARARRGHKLIPSPVHAFAEDKGIEVLTPTSLRDDDTQRAIAAYEAEAVAVVAYGMLIPPALLDVPRHGWINLHFSLLPAWRGAAPVQYAIAAGDDITGASTFRIDEGLDTGPVFGQLTETIEARETAGELLERLSHSGAELLSRTFALLESGEAKPVTQEGDVSLAPTISVADARVDWSLPALAIDRRIRAHTPAPGAWTELEGVRVKLGPVLPVSDDVSLQSGEIQAGKRVLVGTGSTPVELSWVAPAGKKRMNAADWARGARLEAGMCFDGQEQ